MYILAMRCKIVSIPNAMISKPPLPDFVLPSKLRAKAVRISTLNQLHPLLKPELESARDERAPA
jgi:hypothetical protein